MKSAYILLLLSIALLFSFLPGSDGNDSSEKIETIVRAFRKLPSTELEKYNVDLSDTAIEPASPRAVALVEAWKVRQEELREAMKAMIKPAELMVNITNQLSTKALDYLSSNYQTESAITELLINLESLLTDIDNARDFHTLGLWPKLVSFLHRGYSSSIRAKAAWAIGTTTKNSYDYQLWTIEEIKLNESGSIANSTCLKLLLEMLEDSTTIFTNSNISNVDRVEFQKRTLYALSSALRGNLDVQQQILENYRESFFKSILSHLSFAPSPLSSPQVMKKILSLLSDLVEEHEYIRYEIANDIGVTAYSVSETGEVFSVLPAGNGEKENNLNGTNTFNVNQDVYSGPLLGDIFFSVERDAFVSSLLSILRIYLDSLTQPHWTNELTLEEKNDRISMRDCLKNIILIYRSLLSHTTKDTQQRLPESVVLTLRLLIDQRDSLFQSSFFDDVVSVVDQTKEYLKAYELN